MKKTRNQIRSMKRTQARNEETSLFYYYFIVVDSIGRSQATYPIHSLKFLQQQKVLPI